VSIWMGRTDDAAPSTDKNASVVSAAVPSVRATT